MLLYWVWRLRRDSPGRVATASQNCEEERGAACRNRAVKTEILKPRLLSYHSFHDHRCCRHDYGRHTTYYWRLLDSVGEVGWAGAV